MAAIGRIDPIRSGAERTPSLRLFFVKLGWLHDTCDGSIGKFLTRRHHIELRLDRAEPISCKHVGIVGAAPKLTMAAGQPLKRGSHALRGLFKTGLNLHKNGIDSAAPPKAA